jgi:hypothetical protein
VVDNKGALSDGEWWPEAAVKLRSNASRQPACGLGHCLVGLTCDIPGQPHYDAS